MFIPAVEHMLLTFTIGPFRISAVFFFFFSGKLILLSYCSEVLKVFVRVVVMDQFGQLFLDLFGFLAFIYLL